MSKITLGNSIVPGPLSSFPKFLPIITIIQKLASIFKKPAEKIGKTDSVNQNSSVQDVDKVVEIFQNYKQSVQEHTVDVERKVYEEAHTYVRELEDQLSQKPELTEKYQIRIDRVNKNMQRALSRCTGCIDDEVSKGVSLNQAECRAIIKMLPGERKEQAMEQYMQKVLRKAIDKWYGQFREALTDIVEDAEEEIMEKIGNVEAETERQSRMLKELEEDPSLEKTEQVMRAAQEITAACDTIMSIVEV